MKHLLRLIVPCCLLTVIGCGESDVTTFDVVGTVEVDGVSFEGALVVFEPVDSEGLRASATSDADGKYDLTTIVNGDGALAGKYKISVMGFAKPAEGEGGGFGEEEEEDLDDEDSDAGGGEEEQGAAVEVKGPIAKRFGSASTSGLEVEVLEKADGEPNDFLLKVSAE